MKIHFTIVISIALLNSACSTTGALNNNIFSSNHELNYSGSTQDYKIEKSDFIEIKVFQADELTQSVKVDNKGFITMPLIGLVKAKGLTEEQLRQSITTKLRANYMQNPQVTVFIKEASSQRVTVEGEVKKPNIYPLKGEITALQAIALAGGPTALAAPDKVVLFRKNAKSMKAYRLDLNKIRSGAKQDPYLNNDDRLVLHRSNSRYWVKEVASFISPANALKNLTN